MFHFSKASKRNLIGVNPLLVMVSEKALTISKVDFGIPSTGGVRTAELQHELYLDGKSNADGYQNKSLHQFGRALDFYAIDPVTGKASWNDSLLTHVACAHLQAAILLGIKIEWGGFWKSIKDLPHIQLVDKE